MQLRTVGIVMASLALAVVTASAYASGGYPEGYEDGYGAGYEAGLDLPKEMPAFTIPLLGEEEFEKIASTEIPVVVTKSPIVSSGDLSEFIFKIKQQGFRDTPPIIEEECVWYCTPCQPVDMPALCCVRICTETLPES